MYCTNVDNITCSPLLWVSMVSMKKTMRLQWLMHTTVLLTESILDIRTNSNEDRKGTGSVLHYQAYFPKWSDCTKLLNDVWKGWRKSAVYWLNISTCSWGWTVVGLLTISTSWYKLLEPIQDQFRSKLLCDYQWIKTEHSYLRNFGNNWNYFVALLTFLKYVGRIVN